MLPQHGAMSVAPIHKHPTAGRPHVHGGVSGGKNHDVKFPGKVLAVYDDDVGGVLNMPTTVPIRKLPWYPAKVITALLVFLWGLTLWVGAIVNIQYEGFGVYHQYFTNWMWTVNLLFYTASLIGLLEWTGTIQYYVVLFVWWPVFANISQVFWLVIVILYYNPDMITDAGDEYGYGVVLLVDKIKHVIPFLVALAWLHLQWPDIVFLLSEIYNDKHGVRSIVLYIIANLFLGHAIIIGYCLNFDFRVVYNVDINIPIGILLVEFVFLTHLILPILFYSPVFHSFRTGMFVDNADVTKPESEDLADKKSGLWGTRFV